MQVSQVRSGEIVAIQANGAYMLRARRGDTISGADIKARFPEARSAIDFLTFDGDHILQSQINFEDARKHGITHGSKFTIGR